jgi:hypothetical protein
VGPPRGWCPPPPPPPRACGARGMGKGRATSDGGLAVEGLAGTGRRTGAAAADGEQMGAALRDGSGRK